MAAHPEKKLTYTAVAVMIDRAVMRAKKPNTPHFLSKRMKKNLPIAFR